MDTNKSISIRIAAKAGLDKIRGQYQHDLRKGRIPRYVDKSRSAGNSSIVLAQGFGITPGALIKEHARRLTGTPLTAKTAAVLTGIITFSKSAQPMVEQFTGEEQDQIFATIVKRLAQHMDLPPVHVQVHRDESAIHGHFTMLNVTSAGRTYRGNRAAMSKLQDIAAEACQKHGLHVSRGKRKAVRIKDGEKPDKWINKSVAQLHETLPADIAREEQRLAEVYEKIRLKGLEFDDIDLATSRKKNNLDSLEKRIQTYSSRLRSQERELAELKEKIETERLTLIGIKADFEKSVKLPTRPGGRKRLFGSDEEVLVKKFDLDRYAEAIEQQYAAMRRKELELDEILRADFVEQSKYDAIQAERDKFRVLLGESNGKLKKLDNKNFLLVDENKRLRARLSRYEVLESDPKTIQLGKERENASGKPGR